MTKDEREALGRQIQRGKAVETLIKNEGFSLFMEELRTKRERVVTSLKSVESHPMMAKNAGKVDALDDVLQWADKAIRDGKDAAKRLNGKGDTSSEDD